MPHPNATFSLEERFLLKTKREANGCLRWIGAITSRGYGSLWAHDEIRQAHHVAWKLHYGAYPDCTKANGWMLHHTCDNRWCVEATHLERIRESEHFELSDKNICNQHAQKDVCPKCGGQYTWRKNGGRTTRRCLRCKQEYQSNYGQTQTPSYLRRRNVDLRKLFE